MIQYSKEIFSNPIKLREKLAIFLNCNDVSDDSVESYAKAAEKFFDGEDIKFRFTWSWAVFFLGPIFYAYRKCYMAATIGIFASFVPFINLYLASAIKHNIILKFAKVLDKENDETLSKEGGE